MDSESADRCKSNVIPFTELLRAGRRRKGERAGPVSSGGSGGGSIHSGVGSVTHANDAERIEEIRERIRTGYYDRPEILEQIVDRILGFVTPSLFETERRSR